MLVDIRENEKGDVQWVILTASHAQVAVGVHTWVEGYLSPVYREILETLAAEGYKVSSVKREKDGLLKFLTAVADFDTAIRTFGANRTLFPEFREIAAPGPTNPNESTRKG